MTGMERQQNQHNREKRCADPSVLKEGPTQRPDLPDTVFQLIP
jgi:hypothetical protein